MAKDFLGEVQYTWRGRTKRYTYAQMADMDWYDIARMSTKERADLAFQMQQAVKSRLAGLYKSGQYSFAADRLFAQFGQYKSVTGQDYMPGMREREYYGGAEYSRSGHPTVGYDFTLDDAPMVPGDKRGTYELGPVFRKYKSPHNALMQEIAVFQEFLQSDTSTARGVQLVNLHWDKAVFGTDKRGRALHTMSEEERRKFWRVYRELKADYSNLAVGVTSSVPGAENNLVNVWLEHGYDNMSWDEIVNHYRDWREGRIVPKGAEYTGRYADETEEEYWARVPFGQGDGIDSGAGDGID